MSPIGIFDSGYGGLTIFREIKRLLPQYDYLYFGDNARAPYGNRSFETVYRYTRQCVRWMFDQGCPLIILACNTASAKALRTIQQNDLPEWGADKRVLGVIRPTASVVGNFTKTRKVGVLATPGTVASGSYAIEIKNEFPEVEVYQQACPMWVPIIENGLTDTIAADDLIKNDIEALFRQSSDIDCVLLGCTHYPLVIDKIRKHLPFQAHLLSQGYIVASSLAEYLRRHRELESKCSKGGQTQFFTTDSTDDFDRHSKMFLGETVSSVHVDQVE